MNARELAVLIPLAFAAFWVVLLLLISAVGGWLRLARTYGTTAPADGERWRFQDCTLRYALGYNGCVRVVASREGLYLSVVFPFRPWHPPLFFPWPEVSVTRERLWFGRRVRLTLSGEPSVPVRLREPAVRSTSVCSLQE